MMRGSCNWSCRKAVSLFRDARSASVTAVSGGRSRRSRRREVFKVFEANPLNRRWGKILRSSIPPILGSERGPRSATTRVLLSREV